MALKLSDVVENMKQVLGASARDAAPGSSEKILELAADFLLRALVRDLDNGRIAILKVLPESEQLAFVHPRHLARGNTLPLDRDSFAGRVAILQQPLLENKVPEEPHKDFFERIPDERGTVRPIQKMIAAPLVLNSEAIGVVEVSRAAATPEAAGPDFTVRDAENLVKCCRAFAPFIAKSWAPREAS